MKYQNQIDCMTNIENKKVSIKEINNGAFILTFNNSLVAILDHEDLKHVSDILNNMFNATHQ